jgi:hypothetical protein
MTKDIRAKVTLNPDAFKVLEVEAMLQGLSLKDAASKLIIKAACPKCKEILDIMARPPKATPTQEEEGAFVNPSEEVVDAAFEKARKEYKEINKDIDELFQGNEQLCFPANPGKKQRRPKHVYSDK